MERTPRVTEPGYRLGQAPPNKGKRYPPETYTAAEVFALMRACGRGPAGVRNKALIAVLWRSGLRIQEALDLEPRDVDPAAGSVRVRHGKGDKDRVVGMDPAAFAVLQDWLDLRAKLITRRRRLGQPVFCLITTGKVGGPMRSALVRDMLNRAAARAGVEKRVHPHGFRHTCASDMEAEGFGLSEISAQLGHTRVSTTERYIKRVAPGALLRRVQGRAWPGDAPAAPAVQAPVAEVVAAVLAQLGNGAGALPGQLTVDDVLNDLNGGAHV
jgi:integrase/recombinase XerD